MGGSLASELRLHYWEGSKEICSYLAEKGIAALYYPDREDAIGYDFTVAEDRKIRQFGEFIKLYSDNEIRFLLTDIRLENCDNVKKALDTQVKKKDAEIIVFTHAWAIIDQEKKLQTIGKWALRNGFNLDCFK